MHACSRVQWCHVLTCLSCGCRNKAYTLKHDVQQPELPVGFDLSATPVRVEDRGNFRFRRDDDKKMSTDNSAVSGPPHQ